PDENEQGDRGRQTDAQSCIEGNRCQRARSSASSPRTSFRWWCSQPLLAHDRAGECSSGSRRQRNLRPCLHRWTGYVTNRWCCLFENLRKGTPKERRADRHSRRALLRDGSRSPLGSDEESLGCNRSRSRGNLQVITLRRGGSTILAWQDGRIHAAADLFLPK